MILLLTDIPPCKNYTAGLVLDRLVRFIPGGDSACYAIINRHFNDMEISPDLDYIPFEKTVKPIEYSVRLLPRQLGSATAWAFEKYNSVFKIRSLFKQVKKFADKHKVDKIWCVLQGQTMIRLAAMLVKYGRIPVYVQVWDPPTWWIKANELDKYTGSEILAKYEKVLSGCSGMAAASVAMAEEYNGNYGTRTVPVIPSLDKALARKPAKGINNNGRLLIGMAGQLYSQKEWDALISALSSLDWNFNGMDISIRLLGRYATLKADTNVNIEYLGWQSQDDAIEQLSQCDILYCPYWFDKEFETEARLSFPSKLTTYLAAGRAVLFHGPEYSSPSRFLEKYGAGHLCHSLDTDEIAGAIKKLASDNDHYAELCSNGTKAFMDNLTLEIMRKNFAEFLEFDEDFLLPL